MKAAAYKVENDKHPAIKTGLPQTTGSAPHGPSGPILAADRNGPPMAVQPWKGWKMPAKKKDAYRNRNWT
jgi:hypothetical protein